MLNNNISRQKGYVVHSGETGPDTSSWKTANATANWFMYEGNFPNEARLPCERSDSDMQTYTINSCDRDSPPFSVPPLCFKMTNERRVINKNTATIDTRAKARGTRIKSIGLTDTGHWKHVRGPTGFIK